MSAVVASPLNHNPNALRTVLGILALHPHDIACVSIKHHETLTRPFPFPSEILQHSGYLSGLASEQRLTLRHCLGIDNPDGIHNRYSLCFNGGNIALALLDTSRKPVRGATVLQLTNSTFPNRSANWLAASRLSLAYSENLSLPI